MQKLWSRVAQSGVSCRCPQCLHSVRAVGRQATTSAAPWTPRYFTTSTLLYTTLFAAAATYDGARKRERREQWDDAISGLKRELSTLDNSATAASSLQEDAASLVHDVEEEHPHTPSDYDEDSSNHGEGYLDDGEGSVARFIPSFCDTTNSGRDLLSFVQPEHLPKWPEHTGQPIEFFCLPPQSIYATGIAKRRNDGSFYTPKKLEACELSIEILALRFAADLMRNEQHIEAASHMPENLAQILFKSPETITSMIKAKDRDLANNRFLDANLSGSLRRAGLLKYGSHRDVRFCHYEQDEDSRYLDPIRDTNQKLKDAFRYFRASHANPSSILAQAAHILTASSAPPDVDTFNILLIGLSESPQLRHLVDFVIDALREAHMRPNEVTLEAVLRTYTLRGDAEGFAYFVDLMRGKHGGLMVARTRIIHAHRQSANRLVWKDGFEGGKLLQLPHPSPNVFAALLEGVIRFSGLDAGMMMHELMSKNGWGLGMHGYTLLLEQAAHRKRWEEGLTAWRALMLLDRRGRQRPRRQRELVSPLAIMMMIRLCRVCGQTEMGSEVYEFGLRRGVNEDDWELKLSDQLRRADLTQMIRARKQDTNSEVTSKMIKYKAEALLQKAAGADQSVLDRLGELAGEEKSVVEEKVAKAKKSMADAPPAWTPSDNSTGQTAEAMMRRIMSNEARWASRRLRLDGGSQVPYGDTALDPETIHFAPLDRNELPEISAHEEQPTVAKFMPIARQQEGPSLPAELETDLDSQKEPPTFAKFSPIGQGQDSGGEQEWGSPAGKATSFSGQKG